MITSTALPVWLPVYGRPNGCLTEPANVNVLGVAGWVTLTLTVCPGCIFVGFKNVFDPLTNVKVKKLPAVKSNDAVWEAIVNALTSPSTEPLNSAEPVALNPLPIVVKPDELTWNDVLLAVFEVPAPTANTVFAGCEVLSIAFHLPT